MEKAKSQTAKAIETMAAQVESAKAPKPIFTPSQVISQLTEKMEKEVATLVTSELQGVLMDLASEANSRISIGLHLLAIQPRLGSDFTHLLEKFAAAVNRHVSSLWSYIGLAKVASFEFQSNPVARTALFRIWDAKGCYDPANGELKPAVAKALKIHPIPESRDSSTCEVWARRFVDEVNGLVKASRSPRTAADKVEAIQKRHKAIVKSFLSFMEAYSKPTTVDLLAALIAAATNKMGGVEVARAVDAAKEQSKKARIESDKIRELEATESEPARAN